MKKNFIWILSTLVVASFVFFSSFVNLITDWWWFSEVGFTKIFVTSLVAKFAVGIGTGLLSLAFLGINLFLATHSKTPWIATIPAELFGQPLALRDSLVKKVTFVLALLLSLFIGLIASTTWQDVLKFLHTTPFGQADPLLGKDVAFYVFSLPVYHLGLLLLKGLTLISLIGCGLIYVFRRSIPIAEILQKAGLSAIVRKSAGFTFGHASEQKADKGAQVHIGLLLFLFLAVIAGNTYLSLYNLLIVQSGPILGATFTDANVMIPLLKTSLFIYLAAAVLALYYGISGKIAPLMGAILLTFVVGVASSVVPSVFQKLIVAPNELVKETPFIKYNIAATRKAYNLDSITEREISADKPLTSQDIEANNLTVKNVRLWDRSPLLSTFSQIQEIRTYYEFASVDNDRYTINGEIRQIMLSPRELASESLPNKNWINEHLTFTHGYGIAGGPVNQVTPEGLPVLYVKDLPPKAEVKELAVTRPEIYFGELVNDYVIVKTNSKEFDYPKGEENVYAKYNGTGGVETSSFLKRLFYAVQFSSLKMMLSDDITGESRIVYNRNIKERVQKIAPFFTYDRDPYMVVAEGKLYWIIDGYTTTSNYPYSQQAQLNGGKINYIRNSVKVVVDAYNGSVDFYQTDPKDPIMQTYAKIFPDTFKPIASMPKSLTAHLRYPEDIFTLQTSIYTTYHMNDPQIFYNKEDQWEIPTIPEGNEPLTDTTPAMSARHMIMKLPDEKKEEYILMLPFTPRAKDNLSAWMVARNDDKEYGKLVVYKFPKDKLIFGPKQIIGRINQDAEVSRQISLWDQRGSQVIQGPLLVIPIEESLVYVRPLYLKAESGKIPELKRVIVAYENKIAMEPTLEEGLAKIFGGAPSSTTTAGDAKPVKESAIPVKQTTKASSLEDAGRAYEAAIRAQKDGDWAKYGEEIKKLGEILEKLR